MAAHRDLDELRSGLVALFQSDENPQRLFAEGVSRYAHADWDTSRVRFEQAAVRFRGAGNRPGEATALNELGRALLQLGRVEEADARFREALEVFREIGQGQGEGAALTNLANLVADLGRHAEAEAFMRRAVDCLRSAGAEGQAVLVQRNLGTLLCDHLGRGDEGIDLLLESVDFVERNGSPGEATSYRDDLRGVSENLLDDGKRLSERGALREAIDLTKPALRAFRSVGDRHLEATTLNNLAVLHQRLGELQESLECCEEALAVGVEDDTLRGSVLNSLGSLYQQVGRPEDALASYRDALALMPEHANPAHRAPALANLGSVYHDLGRLPEARDAYEESLRTLSDLDAEARDFAPTMRERYGLRHLLGGALHNLASVDQDLGRHDEALERFEEALALRREIGDRPGEGYTLNNLALLRQRMGRVDEALDASEEAARVLHEVGDRAGTAGALGNSGFLLHRAGRAEDAVERFERALEIVEGLRGEILSEELRTSYFATVGDLYATYVLVLVMREDGERAFHVAERGRARTFLDLLVEARAQIHAGVDPELVAEDHRLAGELTAARRDLAHAWSLPDSARDAQAIAVTEKREGELERAYRRHRSTIRQQDPRHAAMTDPEASDVWTVARTQAELLDEDTVLLEYVLAEPASFLFAVTKHELEAHVLPSRKALETSVHELREALVCADDWYPHGHELYRQLIQPVEGMIAGRELLIVADGALHYLPFGLLLTEPAERGAWPTLPYLLRRHAIRHAPSATVAGIVPAESQPRHYDADLAAFADPQGLDERPIPMTANEVRAVAALLAEGGGGDRVVLRVGDAATKAAVAELASGERSFRFFHIATHGLLDPERPQFSGLAFTPGGERDPFWRTFEIFNARIPSELVVLSACETGLGRIVTGEGIVGLTRAFLYAGAPSVCVSLWKVADASSTPLMRAFYEGILAGRPKAQALRDAQLELLDRSPYVHPFWWAPFVLIGDR